MKKIIYIILLVNLVFSQEEILLDRVASVVENKIVLMSDVVLAANAVAAQQKINPNTNPSIYKKLLEDSRESMVEQLLIIEMAEQASQSNNNYKKNLKKIEEIHLNQINFFIPVKQQSGIISFLKSKINELEDFLESLNTLKK